MKKFIYLGAGVGGTLGSFIPALWNAGIFSLWGILFSIIGGAVGVWLGYLLGQYVGV